MKINALIFSILISLILIGCQSTATGDVEEGACPLNDLPYPRPEPGYTGKLELDFTPFASALEGYTPEQVAAREVLVSGKSIPDLQALIDSGELSSVDLVVYYLERIQRYDVGKLNSVLELNPEALEIAQALDDERAAGNLRGPMHGIPVLLKDNIATSDQMHTAAGAAAMLDGIPVGMPSWLASCARPVRSSSVKPTCLNGPIGWINACPTASAPTADRPKIRMDLLRLLVPAAVRPPLWLPISAR